MFLLPIFFFFASGKIRFILSSFFLEMRWVFSFLFDSFQCAVIIWRLIEEPVFFFLIKTGDTVGLAWLMLEGKRDASFVNARNGTTERSLCHNAVFEKEISGLAGLSFRLTSSNNMNLIFLIKTSWVYYILLVTDVFPWKSQGLFWEGEFAWAASRDADNFYVKISMTETIMGTPGLASHKWWWLYKQRLPHWSVGLKSWVWLIMPLGQCVAFNSNS